MKDVQKSAAKPFVISKSLVFEAYRKVKVNKGAPGVDDQTIAEFEKRLKDNLYRLWNRMSSGSYFPEPVRAVEIPKKDGKGVRVLGVPIIQDRIAQTVVKMILEPKVEPLFHDDSYGYRPSKSALDAVGACRKRCWKASWVIDLDIKSFFDTVPHDLIMKAEKRHTDEKWIVLYIERWLKAPMQHGTGLVERENGTPQGSAISPLLANLFMHYAFDMWMKKEFDHIEFERYVDDVVVHCVTEKQAQHLKRKITQRMRDVGLELHPDKTRIVYCKDDNRIEHHANIRFDFCGFTFRPRKSRSPHGGYFVNFLPAVGDQATKAIRKRVKGFHLTSYTSESLESIAAMMNPIVVGWINYYGRYYPSQLAQVLRYIDEVLVRWAMRKYKGLHRQRWSAWNWLRQIIRRDTNLFAHWRFTANTADWATRAG